MCPYCDPRWPRDVPRPAPTAYDDRGSESVRVSFRVDARRRCLVATARTRGGMHVVQVGATFCPWCGRDLRGDGDERQGA